MEFKRRKLKVDIYGEEKSILFPTLKQAEDYRNSIEAAGEDEREDVQREGLFSLLDDCGLDKETAMNMEAEHFETLIGALLPSKKK